jgi:uncharacterized membrane protein YbhN (UPF0104 family)
MVMIPTPGAIGGAELSFGLVYSGIVPAGVVPLLTGVWRFITFYLIIAVAAIILAITGVDFSDGHERRRNKVKVYEEIKA